MAFRVLARPRLSGLQMETALMRPGRQQTRAFAGEGFNGNEKAAENLFIKTTTFSELASLPRGKLSCNWLGKDTNAHQSPRGRVRIPLAGQGDDPTSQEGATSAPLQPPRVSDKKAAAKAEAEKGKSTAIITAAIAVLLGVGYLILIQLLDTRGVTLMPPPPEAFDP